MAGNHAALKKLQLLRDKLELKRDDIAVSKAALEDEHRELVGRKEQLELVKGEIEKSVSEMDAIGKTSRAEKAKRDEFKHEDEALRTTFTSILDQGLRDLHVARQKKLAESEEKGATERELREVSVLFEDEEAVFRITDGSYTFDELVADACRFFELHPLDVDICDEEDGIWPGEASVRQSMAQYDNAYGHIYLKTKELEAEDEDAGVEDVDNILQLLLGQDEDVEEDEEDEAELAAIAAMQAAQAAAGDKNAAAFAAAASTKKKKKLNRVQLIREMPMFILFTAIFVFSLMTRRSTTAAFFQVNALRVGLVEEAFGDFNEKEFMDIRNYEEVFDWLEGVLVEGLYPTNKYNDDEFKPREVGAVMTYNRIVGRIRFRQIRAKPNVGCPGATASINRRLVMNSSKDIFDQLFVSECYGNASPENEETAPYGPAVELIEEHGSCEFIPAPPPPPSAFLDNYGEPPTPKELELMAVRKLCRAFTYAPANETGDQRISGRLGTYGGGGYVRDIDNPIDCRQRTETDLDADGNPNPNLDGVCERSDVARNDFALALEQMKGNLWLDHATRALLVTVTFYNANLGYFAIITFIFEFTLGGTVVPMTKMNIVSQEVLKTQTQGQLLATAIEFVTYCFLVWYTFVQVRLGYRSIKQHGSLGPYVSDVWNMLECVVLVAFYTSTYLRFSLLASLKPDPVIFLDSYVEFSSIGRLYSETFNLDSLCVIALFFKMLKYAQLNLSTSMLWAVLEYSAKDLVYFTLILGTLLAAFSMMATQFFGTQLRTYSSITSSVFELLLVLFGQFDVDGMKQASPLGIYFFIVYIVVMFLIMMNIFLAILGEAYSVIRARNDEEAAAMSKTAKKRSFLGYLKLVRAVVKAKMAQRKQRKLLADSAADGTGAAQRAAESTALNAGSKKGGGGVLKKRKGSVGGAGGGEGAAEKPTSTTTKSVTIAGAV